MSKIIDEIRERAEKATKPPWTGKDVPHAGLEIFAIMHRFPDFKQPLSFFRMPRSNDISFKLDKNGQLHGMIAYESWVQFPGAIKGRDGAEWEDVQKANMDFIAHTRQDIPNLCDALDYATKTARGLAFQLEDTSEKGFALAEGIEAKINAILEKGK